MSAIACVLGDGDRPATARVAAVLGAMPRRGSELEVEAAPGGVALGAATADWERALRPGPATHRRGPVHVAVDASLFHRADLARALDVAPDLPDAALVTAAYARWGLDAFARLEGEFAIVLWDAAAGCLVAARDFAGTRPLYVTTDGTLLASAPDALLVDASVPRDLDLGALAIAAAGLWGHDAGTAYRAVREVPAGHVLVRDAAGTRETMFADFPTTMHAGGDFDEAAEELRALLVEAVRERLAPSGPTALSLSGGWDSSAVGAAARLALAGDPQRTLVPVSISYPPGDPGREDETIAAIVASWDATTSWIDVDAIPLLDDAPSRAARRSLPFAHTYEHWNRALAERASSLGAHVLLDGVGGDQLFQVSDIHLADLAAAGRWLALWRQWRARGGDARHLWRWAVRPALPPALGRAVARLRGHGPPGHHLDRPVPNWFAPRFLAAHGVPARERRSAPALPRTSHVMAEAHAYLRFPFFARIMAQLRTFGLEAGVATRSPLLDDRVVRFALQRPWSDRAHRAETKRLLRRAMRGLLPPEVLAPRPHRTGVTSAYFLRCVRREGPALVDGLLRDSCLASMGMIDLAAFRRAWEHVLAHDHAELAARIVFTLQAEWWARAHLGEAAP